MADVGVTVIDGPVPILVPLQLPENHTHWAPVPRLPPDTLSVLEAPGHTVEELVEIPLGAVDNKLTSTVTETQFVVLQVPSART